jgi:hypothetical protein
MESDVSLQEKNVCLLPLTVLYAHRLARIAFFFSPIALRILRVSDSQTSLNPDHKYSLGRGGHRIDASRNLWTGSGLKMESTSTDVAWGRGSKSQC